MFNNDRYMTTGFKTTVPVDLQIIMFQLVDAVKTQEEVDYLQVFDLSTKGSSL